MKRCITLLLILTFPALASDTESAKRLAPVVEKLRELSFEKPVKVERKSRSAIEAYINKRIAEEYKPEEVERERTVLVLLDLLPEGFPYREFVVGLLRDQVAGYYDPELKSLYLAEHVSGAEAESVLIHEMTHALQDQHFDLTPMMKRDQENDDRSFATKALLEGDAFVVMLTHASGGQDISQLPIEQTLRASVLPPGETGEVPPFLAESLLFPYSAGFRFVEALRKKEGWKAVDRAFRTRPVSTEQILHPLARNTAAGNPISISSDAIMIQLGATQSVTLTNVMGEFGWRLVVGEKAAEGWGGDRYWLVESFVRNEIGLLLATVWDTEKDAVEFEAAWNQRKKKRKSVYRRKGKKMVIGIDVPSNMIRAFSQRWFKAS